MHPGCFSLAKVFLFSEDRYYNQISEKRSGRGAAGFVYRLIYRLQKFLSQNFLIIIVGRRGESNGKRSLEG